MNTYQAEYNENKLWSTLRQNAKRLGREALEKVLLLYYAGQNPKVPAKTKAIIYGALGYVILPIDAIPDVLPGVGFVDDIAVVATALASISLYIDQSVREQARQKMQDWFG